MLAEYFKRFIADETATTAIEYALLGTIIAIALAATFALVGNNLGNMFGGGNSSGGASATLAAAATSIP